MEWLNDMALFVEVVKAKGFRRAAEATGVPNSSVSRRISDLEKSVGLRLLHRTTRKIELTEAGQIYYERCRRIVDEARLAHEQLGEMLAQPSGVLRASLPVDFASIFLAPLIVEFARLYPGISFEFDLTPRKVDLVTEPYDVAIRMGEPEDSALIARRLASLPGQLYASPRYLAQFGTPQDPTELSQHECIGFPKSGLWTLHKDDETRQVQVGGRFVLNSVGMIRRLALLDVGIILMPREVVAEDIGRGLLQPVLSDWQGSAVPVYALTETRLLPAKTQKFIDFLRERFEARVKA
ncbi:LysR family transcriptional regulator [Uliginosibacterium aquaticum]|uniref:LysR family transcriptional regulator n=1 Tax=Uliginosibacterium aquaticum TaxID=2731212 RepID=A0ABX2IDA2_9RHOO|nr:LysR family transcriptional regulator [Uliginosibacterium aquaticum]NSL54556.1 LysR family transcriptional regulator [Uliginosibacterium aquaticum]